MLCSDEIHNFHRVRSIFKHISTILLSIHSAQNTTANIITLSSHRVSACWILIEYESNVNTKFIWIISTEQKWLNRSALILPSELIEAEVDCSNFDGWHRCYDRGILNEITLVWYASWLYHCVNIYDYISVLSRCITCNGKCTVMWMCVCVCICAWCLLTELPAHSRLFNQFIRFCVIVYILHIHVARTTSSPRKSFVFHTSVWRRWWEGRRPVT